MNATTDTTEAVIQERLVGEYVEHATSGTTGRCVATEADGRLIVWRTRSETPQQQTVERWEVRDAIPLALDISPRVAT